MVHFFEDFAVGQVFQSGALTVTAESIKAFAAAFDPQPFHLGEECARRSFFGGLAASGWQTAAITMRLIVASGLEPAGGTIGAGVEDLRWPKPVRPGDALRVRVEITELRPSRSRPAWGVVKVRVTTLNQHDEPVQVCSPVLMVERRPAATPAPLP